MSELRDNAELRRYEMDEQGFTCFAAYDRRDHKLVINWVEAPPELRGSGAAGRLMTLVCEEARRNNWRITPICGYAAAWLRRSKTFGDLVD